MRFWSVPSRRPWRMSSAVEVLALEVLRGEVVVDLGGGLDHRRAMSLGVCPELLGDLHDVDLLAEVVAVEDGLHVDEVDDALEGVLAADRQLDRDRVRAEALTDRLDAAPEVRAGPVELVDEAEAWHAVAVGLAPDRLGLGLHACDGIEDDDRTIEHAQAAFDLDGEVHVPGRIDDVDAVLLPEAGRGRGGDRDAALLLLGHPVHRRRALVDLAELVDLVRVEQDPLGDGRLAGVDVRDDADVPGACERELSCHGGLCPSAYQRKWLKALLASAILWVSSRRLTAAPWPFIASTNSNASFSLIDLPLRLRAACDEPAHTEGDAAVTADLDGHLVRGATDATRLDLDDRRGVAQRSVEHLETGTLRGRLGARERLAQDALREALLAILHELHHEAVRGARHGRRVLGLARIFERRGIYLGLLAP